MIETYIDAWAPAGRPWRAEIRDPETGTRLYATPARRTQRHAEREARRWVERRRNQLAA